MSLARLLDRAVTITTPGATTDRNGDTIPDWTTATTQSTTGWLARIGETEQLDRLLSRWHLLLPADVTLTAKDRITVDGVTYEVDGKPNIARRPGEEHHIEATVKLAEG